MIEYPLNIMDPAVRRDPYGPYRQMRDAGPVLWNPLLGMWMVWRYKDVTGVLTDNATFSNVGGPAGRGDEADGPFGAPTMLNSDPPDHGRYRGVVAKAFTPRTIAAQEPALRRLAGELVSPLAATGPYEVAGSLSAPLPVLAIATMLGVDGRDMDDFRRWSDELITAGGIPSEEEIHRSDAASRSLRAYFQGEIDRRRTDTTEGSDLLARLVAANEGGVLSDAELLASCVLLLVAGNETTTNLITNMTLALARHPDQRELLVKDPSLIPGAVEESLRYDGPVHMTPRRVTRDVEISGQPVKAGERIMVLVAAANRDPEKFTDPDTYDVTRAPGQHVGFGHGIHFCLGSTLARLETRLAMEALLETAPGYRLAADAEPLDYTRSNLRSPRHLPIENGRP